MDEPVVTGIGVTAAGFAGGDQEYLRDEQYRSSGRLDQRAALHRRYSTAEQPWFDWIHDRLGLVGPARVLEVGCGPGRLWEDGAARVPAGVSLVLCDLSPGMVAEAVERATRTGAFVAVEGRPADLMELPFADASFDLVVANHMLYHLPDPAQGVAELARVVTPAGHVVAATNGRDHVRELHEVEAAVFGAAALDQTVRAFGAETGFPILRQRFAEVSWHQYEDGLRCTDPADVLAYSCSSPPGEGATAAEREQLATALRTCVEAGGGVMAITKDSGAFVARRPR